MTVYDYLLAKDTGVTLTSHTMLVVKFANIMCDIMGYDSNNRKRKLIVSSALLHDIGKIRSEFQNILHQIPTTKHVYHNIDGWAVLKCLLSDNEDNAIILSAIYWHHPKPENREKPYMNNVGLILDELSEVDITVMTEYAISMLSSHTISLDFRDEDSDFDPKDFGTPPYYTNNGDDSLPALVRTVLVSADRFASKYSKLEVDELLVNDEKCLQIIKNIDEKSPWGEITPPVHYDLVRFNNQVKDVDNIKDNKTTIVSAPAGYGKTTVGLLWSALSTKKLLWVVPRNVIAYEVYNTIINELQAFGLNNVSVELILASSRIKCTNQFVEIFTSDIVVTNIDNFLFPTVKNIFAHRQFSICNRDVVFDEYHEFLQEGALLYGFINIMKIRHRHLDSKTLLLSATPLPMEDHWDSIKASNKTHIYPSRETHLPAVHTKKYEISFMDDTSKDSFPEKMVKRLESDNSDNYIVFVNSIKNSQCIHNDSNSDILIHSSFLDDDFMRIKGKILARYGKNSTEIGKMGVISTPVLGSSVDMSIKNTYISVCSPELTLQFTGRVNRWGEYEISKITFVYTDNPSEKKAREINYTQSLSFKWFMFLKDQLRGILTITLDEFYTLYNRFYIDNSKEIKAFINDKIAISRNSLSKIYPSRPTHIENTDVNDGNYALEPVKTIKETLRGNNANSVYFICPYYNDRDRFTEPILEKLYDESIHRHFNEGRDTRGNTYKILKKVMDRYDYPKSIRKCKFEMSTLAETAWMPNRPYIAPNWFYDENYGILTITTLNKFKKDKNK